MLVVAVLSAVVMLVLAGCSQTTDGAAQKDSAAPDKPEAVPTIVVLDASDSMNTDDAPGPRIDAAKKAVTALADGLPAGTDFGVVTFGATKPLKGTPADVACADITTAVPLGPLDKTALQNALNGLKAQGRTPIARALQTAADQLSKDGAASIVLVSDGASTCQPDPCTTAASIRQSHPNVTISAVGFRSDDPGLQCVAENGGGIFVTADNAAQLTARLAAAQNAKTAATRLSPTSREGVAIGQRLDDVRSAHPDFPASGRTDGDRVIYVWADCTYIFENGVLVEIAPGDPPGSTGTTIDGVAKGTPGKRAVELYGEPMQDSGGTAYFGADESAGTAYRIGYSGGSGIADGTVTTVVLCHCRPSTKERAVVDGPKVTEIVAVDKSGNPINGFSRGQKISVPLEGKYCSLGLGAVTPGVYRCGSTADSANNCWPTKSQTLLCASFPDEKQLREYPYTGSLPSKKPDAEVRPWTLVLDDGTECSQRAGGSWDPPPPGYFAVYGCKAGSDYKFVFVRDGSDAKLFDKSGKQWTVLYGTNDTTPKPIGVKSVVYSAAR